ncbi:MAG: hypothetical protein LBG43_10180 [Treponema sp.]|jgi:hypothetical protein|nr:hypothetical protein [Treponema sp.]
MEFFLQYWGGVGYFLAKVLLVRAEFVEKDKNLRLTRWVVLLAGRRHWIAAAIETAAVPAMPLGIAMTLKQNDNPHTIVDWSIKIFTCLMILFGVSHSVYTRNENIFSDIGNNNYIWLSCKQLFACKTQSVCMAYGWTYKHERFNVYTRQAAIKRTTINFINTRNYRFH